MFRSLPHATLLLALLLAVALNAQAGTIILSGDINTIHSLDGSLGPLVLGNQLFFQNILGSGTQVVVHDNCAGCAPGPISAISIVNNFYNGLSGVNSSVLTGPITSAALSGTNLFVSILPATAFSPEELTALASFGGDITFFGENTLFAAQNGRINAALTGLGSSMSILNVNLDGGLNTATGSQIAADPYTLGITSFGYGGVSQISPGDGKGLFFSIGGQPFIGYERISVTEPLSLLLIGLGLGGICIVVALGRRDRTASFAVVANFADVRAHGTTWTGTKPE